MNKINKLDKMNYYEILQVPTDASYDSIKNAYKQLALKYHPDKNSGKTIELFKKITEAYQVISDPYKRGKYDAMLENDTVDEDIFKFDDSFFKSFQDMLSQPFFQSHLGNNFPFMQPNFNMTPPIMPFGTPNFSGNGGYHNSRSSKVVKTVNSNGVVKTKKSVTTNNNGKKSNHYQEYVTDKSGNKHIIKNKKSGKSSDVNKKKYLIKK